MNDELRKIWKEISIEEMGYYPGIFLEGPRKTVQNLSEDIPSQNFNQAPKYTLEM